MLQDRDVARPKYPMVARLRCCEQTYTFRAHQVLATLYTSLVSSFCVDGERKESAPGRGKTWGSLRGRKQLPTLRADRRACRPG